MSNWRVISKAAFLGVFWTAASVLLGMAPVLVRMVLAFISTKKQMMGVEEMLREGLLIGLLLALVGAVGIDWLFSPVHKVETFSQKLFFVVFPWLTTFLLGVAYTGLFYAIDTNSLNVPTAELFCKWAFLICVVYCMIAKFFLFLPRPKSP